MEERTFSIPNISCGHCTAAIKEELSRIEGVKTIEGNVQAKTVRVQWGPPASREQIVRTLEAIQYPVAE